MGPARSQRNIHRARSLVSAARSPLLDTATLNTYIPTGSSDPQRKIVYVVGIPEWNCLIGTGMYMEDIDAENRTYLRNALGLGLGLFALIMGVMVVFLRPMVSGYHTLLVLFERVSRQPDDIPPVPVERFHAGSESWKLLSGFENMLTDLERHKQAVRDEQLHRYEAEQAAAQAERDRLARDLHDAVTQTLFSASLIADVLPRLWERDPAAGRERLDELRQLTRGALAEMRTLLLELRPASLTEAELTPLLAQLVDAFTGRTRIATSLETARAAPVPPDVKIALYRIAQEALNNIAKHSGASHVMIELVCADESCLLTIRDDCCGFDASAVPADLLGLRLLRERAESVGAALMVESQVGHGTIIRVSWPQMEKRGD